MELFNSKHLLLDIQVKSQEDAFKQISHLAKTLKIVDSEKELALGFKKREDVATTAMVDGIAIPHTMSANINHPAVIVARFANGVEWKADDGQPVKLAIALLVPEKNRASNQVEILSKIATALLDDKFKSLLLTNKSKPAILKAINNVINAKPEKVSVKKTTNIAVKASNDKKILIAGVTACATGIAHTYMAKEAIDKAAVKLNYNSHVESEGQNGRENPLTSEIIKKAEAIIVATDINVETDRFIGKKVLFGDTNMAINKPEETIKKALTSPIFNGKTTKKDTSGNDIFATQKSGFMKHFLSGVSKMIPFIVFSGIVFAIVNAIAMGAYQFDGSDASRKALPEVMRLLLDVAGVGFTLFIGVMGAYIAESIGGRAAVGPGFIATFVASTPGMYYFWGGSIPRETIPVPGGVTGLHDISLSIVAAIMMGFAAGYLVKYFNTIKVHKNLRPIMSILVIPVVCSSILVFPFFFFLSGPLGFCMNYFGYGLAVAGTIPGVNFLIGFLLGFMVGFDMGGPINKIATATASALILIDPRLMGAVACAIPIAPLGCGLATLLARKTFDENERGLGYSGLALGFMGISEGAIPFFAKRPKQVLIANVISSAVAGGLAFLFYVGGHIGMWGGPIDAFVLGIYADSGTAHVVIPQMFGGNGAGVAPSTGIQFISILWFFAAMAAGVALHAFVLVSLIKIAEGSGKFSNWKIWKKLHLSNKGSGSSQNVNKYEINQVLIAQARMKQLNWMFKHFN